MLFKCIPAIKCFNYFHMFALSDLKKKIKDNVIVVPEYIYIYRPHMQYEMICL